MTDDNRKLYVLYFEDNPDFNQQARAEQEFNIEITFCETTEDGIQRLNSNPSKWDSVILDANLPLKSGQSANFKELIETIRIVENMNIPYYIYSGNGDRIVPLIQKKSWQDVAVYDKGIRADFKLMCGNIRKSFFLRQDDSAKVKMKFPVISEFMSKFDGSVDLQLANETRLVKLFKPLIGSIDEKNLYPLQQKDDNLMNDIRKILEEIYQFLCSTGFIGPWSELTSLTVYSEQIRKKRDSVVPIYVKEAFIFLSYVTNFGSHSKGTHKNNSYDKTKELETDGSVAKDISDGNAPYVISACELNLLIIMKWFCDYNEQILSAAN